MKVGFWRATGTDDRWAEYPSLAGLCLEAHAKHVLGDEVEFEFCTSADQLVNSDAEVAAISSVTDVWPWAVGAIETCQAAGKHVVIGGPHVSALPDSLADTIVVGEGEDAFVSVLRDGPSRRGALALCQGVELDLPKAQHLPIGALSSPGNLAAVASRGCPYRCSFCTASRMWGKVRRFSPGYVARWLREHAAEYDIVRFFDLTLLADLPWFERLAERMLPDIEAGLYRVTMVSACTNLIGRPVLALLQRLGVEVVGVGMESFSQRILSKLKPHCTVEDHERAVRLCYEYGIMLHASFILGAPGETDEDLQTTYDFIERWQGKHFMQAGLYVLTPYPGTDWWDYALERGIITEPIDWSRICRLIRSADYPWETCVYLNEDTMPRERCAEWQRKVTRLCRERDDALVPMTITS